MTTAPRAVTAVVKVDRVEADVAEAAAVVGAAVAVDTVVAGVGAAGEADLAMDLGTATAAGWLKCRQPAGICAAPWPPPRV